MLFIFIYMRVQVVSLFVLVSGVKIERVCVKFFCYSIGILQKLNLYIYYCMNDFNVFVYLCFFIKNENGNIKFFFVIFILVL